MAVKTYAILFVLIYFSGCLCTCINLAVFGDGENVWKGFVTDLKIFLAPLMILLVLGLLFRFMLQTINTEERPKQEKPPNEAA